MLGRQPVLPLYICRLLTIFHLYGPQHLEHSSTRLDIFSQAHPQGQPPQNQIYPAKTPFNMGKSKAQKVAARRKADAAITNKFFEQQPPVPPRLLLRKLSLQYRLLPSLRLLPVPCNSLNTRISPPPPRELLKNILLPSTTQMTPT